MSALQGVHPARAGGFTAYSPRSDLSGSVLSLLGMVRRLPADGLFLDLVFREEGPALDLARRQGLLPRVMASGAELRGLPRRAARKATRALVLARLMGHLVRRRPRFLYVNTVADPAPLRAARWLRIPVLLHFRDSPSYLDGGSRFGERRRRLALGVPRRFLACSHASALALTTRGIPAEAVEVIHNGIDVETFTADPARRAAVRDRLDLSAGDVLTVLVAGIRPEKGIATLIRAAALLRDQVPEMRYVVVGGPLECEHYRDNLAPLARTLGVDDRLRFVGSTEDVPGYLDAADLVVVPSTDEPFGRVTVEAMSMGKPVVASRVGGIPEVLREGETGLLTRPSDPPALAEGLASLARDPGRRERMGSRGREVALERFSEERYAADVERALRRFARACAGADPRRSLPR